MSANTSKKGNGVIIAAILAVVGAVVAYLAYTKYAKGKVTGVQTPTNNTDGTGSSGGNQTQTPTQSSEQPATIAIYGVDEYDSVPRDWQIFTANPTNKCVGSSGAYGVYSGLSAVQKTVLTSGATWRLSLTKGTYWLIIGQSGGSGFGTYSGYVSVNGQEVPFANVTHQTAAQFTVY